MTLNLYTPSPYVNGPEAPLGLLADVRYASVSGGAVQPSPTLRWKAVEAPDLLGYRIYWRKPSEVNWTRSRFVGNVTEYMLEDVIIDNYFFGVAAVDREGHESMVSFPR